MHVKGLTPILNVSDLEQSFAWFAKLGWKKHWDWGTPPTFGAVLAGGCEIFLCQDGQGSRGKSERRTTGGPDGDDAADAGVWMSMWVDDVDAVYRHCQHANIEIPCPPTDEPWGVREMLVRHPDGHVFRIGHDIEHEDELEIEQRLRDTGRPLEIERVDVPVRLERRLAALLHDLARHKRMSIDSCLEETLLHTFERVGGGVASPHTHVTLDHIQALKDTHGIDYDTHASYRFVERKAETEGHEH